MDTTEKGVSIHDALPRRSAGGGGVIDQAVMDAVELAYQDETSNAIWLRRVIGTLAPVLQCGLGVFGWC
jgi:hypothetical protein